MSTKQDNARLRADNEALNERLREAQELAEAQLRNVERLATKAARTDTAEAELAETHANRKTAWSRVAELERAAESQQAMAAVVTRFLAEHLTSASTTRLVVARDLRDQLTKAGCAVEVEAGLPAQAGGGS
ncbi:hypothetical protein [Streptacidiphilus cavernicola]|uniref:Uncharacterized protein n=1 Tax=Streptacidiphilus cavernicola TaxID=3342716 RepID=A0ABV6W474_9ACTN